jgi:FkbM family methyltransferase
MEKILFDIGANRGLYTDSNAKKYDKFILVEANKHLCNFLKNNYINNPNIIIEQKIVSSDKNTVFYISNVDVISSCDSEWINNSRFSNKSCYNFNKTTDNESITIDELVEKYGIPEYIKIDVEGYELNVLKSMTKKYCPIGFEWAEEKKDELLLSLEYVKSLGYEKFCLQKEDKYDFVPEKWLDYNQIYKIVDELCNIERKLEWGMIHCS